VFKAPSPSPRCASNPSIVSSSVFKFLCARKTPLHPERYYPHARIRVFHHSSPEIPGSARERKPRSFFLCSFVVQADVSKPEQISRLFKDVQSQFGKLEILVSNARPELAKFYRPPLDISLEQWRKALDSQAQAFLLEAQMAAALMPDGGRMIAISYSPSGRTGSWQPWVAMGAAKAALDALARYFAVALAKRGITVNVISPGATDDSVVSRLPTEVFSAIKAWHESGWTPMGRVGTPADIGNAVVLLCRDGASFITGQTIHVDGGASIMDSVFPLNIQQG